MYVLVEKRMSCVCVRVKRRAVKQEIRMIYCTQKITESKRGSGE